MALEKPEAPTVFSPGDAAKHNAEVSCVAWNSQVAHILATGATNGVCMIWDLKQKRPWCSLSDPHRAPVSAIAWNPNEAQHIITASEDDQKPVIKLWDLRSSTSTPLAELNGHTAGNFYIIFLLPYFSNRTNSKEYYPYHGIIRILDY